MAPELGEGLFSLLTIAAMTAVFLCPGKSQTIAKRTTKIVVVCNKDERVVEGKNKYMFESDGIDIGPEAPSPTSFKEKNVMRLKSPPNIHSPNFSRNFQLIPSLFPPLRLVSSGSTRKDCLVIIINGGRKERMTMEKKPSLCGFFSFIHFHP